MRLELLPWIARHSCVVRDERHANERQSSLSFVARDQRAIRGERGVRDPGVIRWPPSAGGTQLAVARENRAIDIDDGSLCEHGGQQPQGTCSAVRRQQHARIVTDMSAGLAALLHLRAPSGPP